MKQVVKKKSGFRPAGVCRWPILLAVELVLLAGCAGLQIDDTVGEPLREPRAIDRDEGETLSQADERDRREDDTTGLTIIQPPERWRQTMPQAAEDVPDDLPEGPFGVNFEAMPVPAFIDEVFGRILELDLHMDEAVREADDLVTLRLVGPNSGADIYRATIRVLARYGVSAYRDNDLYHFAVNPDAAGDPLPLLATGRSLPSVPDTHRPVFQFVPVHRVRATQVSRWLDQMFTGRELEIMDDAVNNAIILKGRPTLIRQALSAVEMLDQPSMRGRGVLRVDPVWRGVGSMSDELQRLLQAQGIVANNSAGGSGSVLVIPVEPINALFAFAGSEEVLEQIQRWARELDQSTVPADEHGIFRYRVQNTSAESIAGVLSNVVEGGSGQTRGQPEGERDRREPQGAGRAIGVGGGLVVDMVRNAILFRGTGEQWQRLRPLIVQMDAPTPMVLVEVTIAEITLTDQQDLGVEGLVQELDLGGGFTGQASTIGGLGLGGSGLSATLDNPGDARLVLNAFRSSERVRILSRPHLLVKSGSEASIDVGTQVPIITSQGSTPDFDSPGGSGILQEIAFRETGVIMSVTPIVRGRGVVDLFIEQEVSEAQQTETSNINSPSIFTRRIQTELTARDGRALLMGGLISENRTEGTSGVPGLSRIPLIGRLFRTEGENSSRTELAVLLIPYVLPGHEDAETVTDAFRRRLGRDHPAAPENDER